MLGGTRNTYAPFDATVETPFAVAMLAPVTRVLLNVLKMVPLINAG
jgi:hypothetical protein